MWLNLLVYDYHCCNITTIEEKKHNNWECQYNVYNLVSMRFGWIEFIDLDSLPNMKTSWPMLVGYMPNKH